MKRIFELKLEVNVDVPESIANEDNVPDAACREEFIQAFFCNPDAVRHYYLYQVADQLFSENLELENLPGPEAGMDIYDLLVDVAGQCSMETEFYINMLYGGPCVEDPRMDVDLHRNIVDQRLGGFIISALSFEEREEDTGHDQVCH